MRKAVQRRVQRRINIPQADVLILLKAEHAVQQRGSGPTGIKAAQAVRQANAGTEANAKIKAPKAVRVPAMWQMQTAARKKDLRLVQAQAGATAHG